MRDYLLEVFEVTQKSKNYPKEQILKIYMDAENDYRKSRTRKEQKEELKECLNFIARTFIIKYLNERGYEYNSATGFKEKSDV